MRKMEIATALEETADFLEIEDLSFKPRLSHQAAEETARLGDPIEQGHEEGRLTEIPGVGDSAADDLAALLDDGSIPRHAAFREENAWPCLVPEAPRCSMARWESVVLDHHRP